MEYTGAAQKSAPQNPSKSLTNILSIAERLGPKMGGAPAAHPLAPKTLVSAPPKKGVGPKLGGGAEEGKEIIKGKAFCFPKMVISGSQPSLRIEVS